MKYMLKAFFCAMVLAVVQTCSVAAPLPAKLAKAIGRIEAFYAERASTASRVQLMIIAPDVFVDPPPSSVDFAAKANVTVAVDGPTASDFTSLVVAEAKSSDWKEAVAPGYPRWCWRIVDDSGTVIASFLIDQERRVVGLDGGWYNVSPGLVKRLTSDFMEFATKEVLTSSRDKLR